MTDQSQEQTGTTGFSSSALSLEAVGRILVEAREKMGLSVDDVGTRLRLTPKQVEAMEAGRMEDLPGPAFVRGFLRNYAKLLQIDPEPLLEACRSHGVELPPKYISLHSENIEIAGRERKGWTIYLAGIIIVILLLAAWFAYTDFMAGNTPAQPAEEAITQELPGTTLEEAPIQPLPQIPMPETVPGQEAPAADAASPATPASGNVAVAADAPQAAATGAATLVVTASETSWVSVMDRDGKELYGRNVQAGSSQTISGTPPLKLTLGNATGIQVTYNGNPVDIAPHIRSNVARLSLE
jgi:cytoskeleton protein RodZ